MPHTIKDVLTAGLLASGFSHTDTRSGRVCLSGVHKTRSGLSVRLFIWLGSHGSCRYAKLNAFTHSQPVPKNIIQIWYAAGFRALTKSKPQVDSYALLDELDS